MTTGISEYSEVVQTARDYYNSDDAEAFYSTIWGGEDIHIGMYHREGDSIAEAGRRATARLARTLEPLGDWARVLDMGSGYGGPARYVAGMYGCRVTGLNLSEVENTRARELNAEQGLSDRVEIVDGSFESVPADDNSFHAVFSQDALLHSDRRDRAVGEAVRVLKPGGVFAFTDIMQADDCPPGVLDPILARIHLTSLASPDYYRGTATEYPLEETGFTDLTHHLVRHYGEVLDETETRESELRDQISEDYLSNMKRGLARWVEGGERGYLVWGIFAFRKLSRS